MADWQKALQKNFCKLVSDLANPLDVAEFLYSGMDKPILTESMVDEIKAKKTTKDKCREMITILSKRGPKVPQGLYQAFMETGNDDLAELLIPYIREQTKDERKYTPSLAELLIPYIREQTKDERKYTPSQWPPTKEEQERMEKDKVITLKPKDPNVQLHYYSEMVYPMRAAVRGYALIIENESFDDNVKHSTRYGSEKDSQNLKSVLGQLHFDVVEISNASRQEMLDFAREYSTKPDLKDHDCFIMAIFSHGKEEGILARDGQTVAVNELKDFFIPTKCPALNEKPKVFLIQACRGEKSECASGVGGEGVTDGLTKEMAGLSVDDETDAGLDAKSTIGGTLTVHSEADFLLGYATPEGNYAWRHKKMGSWFMQAIVWILKYHAHEEHLEEILTRVANFVSLGRGHKGSVTVSEKNSSLRRKLYFFPGITGDPPRTHEGKRTS